MPNTIQIPYTRVGLRNLICVLDWGLGHASRSLALAHHLRSLGEEVEFASSGAALLFLQRSTEIPVHPLPPYQVRYKSQSMIRNVAFQMPAWMLTMLQEKKEVRKLVARQGIDRIISDNRFGCYDPQIESVFLSHQLHPIFQVPLADKIYVKYLQNFSSFWVPDKPDQELSGQLSDSAGYKAVSYIGPLSRLKGPTNTNTAYKWTSVALLSGPEPMRSQLEALLRSQYSSVPGLHLLIRGRPEWTSHMQQLDSYCVIDFADDAFLCEHLPEARHIISRCGYSSLMDFSALGCLHRLIAIPTPGQTEQFYLANRLKNQHLIQGVYRQNDFKLNHCIQH